MKPPIITLSHPLPVVSGYQIVEQLYLGSRTAVYRAIQTAAQRSVVIKVLRSEYPTFGELVQFRNQYAITRNLTIPGIIRPLGLESVGSCYALVMEDWGGIALDQFVQARSLCFAEILAIALQIADILHDLAQHRIIHKDIKPANILIHPESKQIRLIDFSIASLLPKESQELQNLNGLEGTLAYLAPEQTGRMNRGIDYRVDFYALGVTLYQLLTGTLPFTATEPLELIHCHIAKTPRSIAQVNSEVPAMIAAIVAKLMAKNAEDRYQSAIGLKHDFSECLTQWKGTGSIRPFELGQRDLSDRFLIPEKLYGRESEVQTLLNAFDRVAAGSSELMLVAGFSGIGKTAVVNEVHKPIVRQRGYFSKGKFDQFNRNIPLSAFVQALRDLIGQLLSESDAQVQLWKTRILEAIGENGQVLIDVIPELEQVIGKQPIAPELSGSAAQNRFNLLFQRFIEVFTTAEHPLVLFLDDLQWADSASLQLLTLLMSDNGYLLMLGAYRDNEVSAAHPFMLTVEDLKKAAVTVRTITLNPLALADTNRLIAETLNCTTELAQPLTELIDRKTQGNPFFTTQFLKALHEGGQIQFDRDRGYWQCDIAQVNALALTDDVVEFMAVQLQKLPVETQQVLKLAACIGNQFDLETLAIVSERSPVDAATALWKALQEGLILPINQVYKFFQDGEQSDIQNTINPTYRFLHDRVQQAAYSLIAEGHRATIHYRIGQLFLNCFSSVTQEERIFEIVGHLNPGKDLIVDPTERFNLARLNLMAGHKAISSNAYGAALEYFNHGIDLLPDDAWIHHYAFTLELHHNRLEAAYLNTQFAELEVWGELVMQQTTSLLDRIKVYETRIMSLRSQGQFLEAVETGRQVLKRLGFEFPSQPTPADIATAYGQSRQAWQGRTPMSLLDLPAMQEPQILAAMQILTKISQAAFVSAPALLPLLVFKQVELSIQYGNSPISIISYADYSLILCGIIGDIPTGYEFGQLSLTLLEHLQFTPFKSRAYLVVNSFTCHWKEPLRDVIPRLLEGYRSGLESGDWECVALNLLTYSYYQYWAGHPLPVLAEEMVTYRQAISQVKQESALRSHETHLQAVLGLLGETEVPYRLQGEVFDAEKTLPCLEAANDRTALFYVYINQAVLCYLFEQDEQAAKLSILLEKYGDGARGFFLMPIGIFYSALIQLRCYPSAIPDDQALILARIAAYQKQLQGWATHAACNHQHRWELVEAETCRVLGNYAAAIDLYDRAVAGAAANGYIQEAALANELAAKFYLGWGKEKVAAGYLQEAYYGYAQWGAKAKIQDLENRHPHLLAPILQQQRIRISASETLFSSMSLSTAQAKPQTPTSSSTSISASFDLATVLKASQALSSEIQLDKLLTSLMTIVVEAAGADKAGLVLRRPHALEVVVKYVDGKVQEIQSLPLSQATHLPISVVQYVDRTGKLVILETANRDRFAHDVYLQTHQPASFLCVPIFNRRELIAILYVENSLTAKAFTSDRVELLNVLCAQAAISLENARLYQQSQQAEAALQEREQFLSSIYDGAEMCIFVLDVASDGNFRYAGWNTLAERVFGVRNTDVIGKTSIEVFGVEQGESMDRWLAQAVGTGAFVYAEQYIPLQGQDSWWFSTLNPLKNEQGQVYRIIGTGFDVSDRKRAEAATLQKSQELNQALQDLQNTQLQMVQSEKMASLGNLVAGIAHEINNPIGFLNGSINNAKDYVQDLLAHLALYQQHCAQAVAPLQTHAEDIDLEFLSEDLPKLLNSMKGATDRIKGISTSLRTFSRADTDHKVSADLHGGIDSTLLILKYRLKANEHRPAIEVIQDYGDLPAIDCFPGQLNQVFMNILANAIDMFDELAQQSSLAELEENPQIITIQTAIVSKQDSIEIRIRDNGKGMTEQVKAKIFDHLFTTKDVGKGTGLGLAIARQIVVEKHGGSLEVQSALGRGSEFCIRLPIADSATNAA